MSSATLAGVTPIPGLPICESVSRIAKLKVFWGFSRAVLRGNAAEADFLSSLDRRPRAGDSPRTGERRDPRRQKLPNADHRPINGLFPEGFQKTRCGTARGLYPPG